jgi:hypothetical protein
MPVLSASYVNTLTEQPAEEGQVSRPAAKEVRERVCNRML